MSDPRQSPASSATTNGIRVEATPFFIREQSDLHGDEIHRPRFVFGYTMRIVNGGRRSVRLLRRHWLIIDGEGEKHEVEGEGVVGHQPCLAPGEVFEYSSFCPLPTAWGTMEGCYHMQPLNGDSEPDGEAFPVQIARFYLVTPQEVLTADRGA